MEVKILRTREEVLSLEDDWKELLQHIKNRQVFDEWVWFEGIVRNLYDESTEFFVVTIKDHKRCISIAPLCIEPQGRIQGRVLKHIVSRTADYCKLYLHKDYNERSLLKEITKQIHNNSNEWDMLLLLNMNSGNNFTFLLEDTLKKYSNTTIYKEQNTITPYLIYKDYDKKIIRKEYRNRARRERNLEKDHEIEIKINEPFNQNVWDSLVAYHKDTWKRSVFNEKRISDFYMSLIPQIEKQGQLEFSYLKIDENLAAVHFGFKDERKVYYYIPVYNNEYKQTGAGGILLQHILDYYKDKKEEFDFLRGDEGYKFDFTDQVRMNYYFYIINRHSKRKFLLNIYIFLKLQVKQNERISKWAKKLLGLS
jgi:CelD/BcsL family acetyltransferase involved in cellulose biosynthesis